MQNLPNLSNLESGPLDPSKEDQAWYIKYGVKGLGTVAGVLAILLGAVNAIFSVFTPICIIFNIWQVLVGFVVTTIESPCCFFLEDKVKVLTNQIQSKPLYFKAAVYVGAPLPSLIFCFGLGTFLGSGLIIATGVVYGFLALGKKASREDMARTAQSMTPTQGGVQPGTTDKAILVENLRDPKPGSVPTTYQNSAPVQHFGPPPAYNDIKSNGASSGGGRIGWDTSYTTADLQTPPTYNPSGSVVTGSVNPVPSNPYNPFQ